MSYRRYSTNPRASLAAPCQQGRRDVFPISTTASVVCDDASGLRTTSFKAQEPVCLGSLLLRVLSGSYFKFISERRSGDIILPGVRLCPPRVATSAFALALACMYIPCIYCLRVRTYHCHFRSQAAYSRPWIAYRGCLLWSKAIKLQLAFLVG